MSNEDDNWYGLGWGRGSRGALEPDLGEEDPKEAYGKEIQGDKGPRGSQRESDGHWTQASLPPKGAGQLLTFRIHVLFLGFRHRLTCWLGGSRQGQVRTSPRSWLPHPCTPFPFPGPLPPPESSFKTPQPSPALLRSSRGGVGSPEGPPPSFPSALSRHLDETGGKSQLEGSPVFQRGHVCPRVGLGVACPLPTHPAYPRSALRGPRLSHTLSSLPPWPGSFTVRIRTPQASLSLTPPGGRGAGASDPRAQPIGLADTGHSPRPQGSGKETGGGKCEAGGGWREQGPEPEETEQGRG